MEGNGYIGDKTMGVNIHSCLAATPEGLALGVLDQIGFNRAGRKNTALTREWQKNRLIEEKESVRRLATMENAGSGISDDTKVIHICDREGDIYELFDKAIQSGRHFLIRICENRMTVENERILDNIRKTHSKGGIQAAILLLTLYVDFEVKFRGFFPYLLLKVKLLVSTQRFYFYKNYAKRERWDRGYYRVS